MALIGEDQTFIVPISIWEARGGRNVGIVIIDMGKIPDSISLAITEETIASASQDYFIEIWERIPPIYKDKEFIYPGLKKRLNCWGSV